jgi:hypothetical protein
MKDELPSELKPRSFDQRFQSLPHLYARLQSISDMMDQVSADTFGVGRFSYDSAKSAAIARIITAFCAVYLCVYHRKFAADFAFDVKDTEAQCCADALQ